MKRTYYYFSFLALVAALTWGAFFVSPDSNLHIIACDVGQGDAILITHRKTQILVDGGPDNKVLDCLGRHLPFWDREIELIVLTHPEKDHYQGLIEVVRRYKVDNFLSNGLDSSSAGYGVLKKEVGGRGIRVIPSQGLPSLRLGLIHLDILHPSEEFMLANSEKTGTEPMGLYESKGSANNFSIQAILSLGDFEALLTGDIEKPGIDSLLASSNFRTLEYLKVPHHGSKNGLTRELLERVSPQVAVISLGKNNSYGHPHKEILDMLTSQAVKISRTDELGDVEIRTDGKKWW